MEEKTEVFISFKRSVPESKNEKTPDCKLAEDLQKKLLANGINSFYSERDVDDPEFEAQIINAIKQASIIVVVGTKTEYMESTWVHDEWSMFINEIRCGHKPKGSVVAYLHGLKEKDVPMSLNNYALLFDVSQTNILVEWIKQTLNGDKDDSGSDFVSSAYAIKQITKEEIEAYKKIKEDNEERKKRIAEEMEENKNINEVNVNHSGANSGNGECKIKCVSRKKRN